MPRVRACIKCREYVIIHPNNPLNQNKINIFEKKHYQHTLITVSLEEVKDQYQIYREDEINNSENANTGAQI